MKLLIEEYLRLLVVKAHMEKHKVTDTDPTIYLFVLGKIHGIKAQLKLFANC